MSPTTEKDILKKLANQINCIQDKAVRTFTVSAIKASPLEYWVKPSAQHTGHHPPDELGEWGNLLHVKRGVEIGMALAEAEDLGSLERDYLVSALLIHDIGKYGVDGKEEKINPKHPMLVREILRDVRTEGLEHGATVIFGIAVTHMGRFSVYGRMPWTRLERLGHYADYLASREYMTIEVK